MLRKIFRKGAGLPIVLYQKKFSKPLHEAHGENAGCRFQGDGGLTCSAFALAAIEKHGVLKGYMLGANRLAACNPHYIGGDYYPVPENVSLRDIFGNMRIKQNIKAIKSVGLIENKNEEGTPNDVVLWHSPKLKLKFQLTLDPSKLDLHMFYYLPDYIKDELSNNPAPPAHK